ncbi:MAG TPA: SPOR domain-containing protein [Rubrivivax sp.]|nr:SPOR domain-containing protein [Rubrivivax sp.]
MLSFLKRKDSPPPAGAMDEAASVQAARTRARRRLIGAAVLIGIGIIGFPLLFETQPRPIAVNIPIEIPSRDQAPPLKLPAPETGPAAPPRATGPVVSEAVAEVPAEPASAAASGSATPVAAAAPAAAPASAARAERPASAAAVVARAAPAAPETSRDAQRAQALLDGKPVAAISEVPAAAPAAKAPRFVVQAGAYTEAGALREARQKVEKLGLKTYTQVIDTDSGSRTRVRVGPFETREEAEKAAARIKSAGLAANILSL